ncbi:MAG: DUF4386 domain-containing protein [Candidatus Hodarchaeales archaeon]
MSQELSLSRRLCARNAGIGMIIRLSIGFFVFFCLNTIFEIPGETTLLAAKNIKVNVLLFLLVIIAVLIMSFCTLMAAVALNNVLMSVNKNISIIAAVFRLIEGLFFIISMILLFLDVSSFNQVLFIGHVSYALYLSLVGYLVFKSGYLNRILGIFLVIGGLVGYLIEGATHFFLPSFEWISSIGIIVAVIAEIILGALLVMKAMKLINKLPDPKRTITMILKELGEVTTAEIIDKASQVSHSRDCKDRVPGTLVALEKEKRVSKRISKEKKAIVWRLVN